jgi:hypothetical protein
LYLVNILEIKNYILSFISKYLINKKSKNTLNLTFSFKISKFSRSRTPFFPGGYFIPPNFPLEALDPPLLPILNPPRWFKAPTPLGHPSYAYACVHGSR